MKYSLKQNKTRSKSAGFIHINFRANEPKTIRQSISRQNHQTDLFMGMYNGKKISEQNQSKLILYKGVPMQVEQIVKLKTKTQQRTTKTVQQLLEQNIQLKNQINKLKQQISIIKAQMSVNYKRKSEIQLGKEMEIEFYKDVYWSNNEKSFRIVGMRQQYQKLKKQYNDQSKQLNQANLKLMKNGIIEAQIYIGELQLQNKRFKAIIQEQGRKFTRTKSFSTSNIKSKSTLKGQDLAKTQSLLYDLQTLKQRLKQKDNKITFLEKAIISKDNKQHSLNKRARKIQKQNDILESSHNNLLDQLQLMKKRLQIQSIKFKSFHSEQINRTKRQFRKQLYEKDKRIKQLEQINRNLQQSANKNNNMNLSSNAAKSVSGFNPRITRRLSLDYGNKDLMTLQEENQGIPSRRFMSDHKQQNQNRFLSDNSEILVKVDIREPKRADKKHSNKAQKVRKVQFFEVQHLGELLRYRMIGFKVASNQIKDYFLRKKVFTQQSNRSKSEKNEFFEMMRQVQKDQEIQWQDQYVTMRQIKNIVTKQPFNLDSDQSLLLSRYLIQDCDDQFVYCDQINENKRQIVKSIIKSLIGPYELTSQADIAGYNEVLTRFSANLKTTLTTYYPEGILAKQKLIQIVKGIGVQLNAKQRQLLIAKASVISSNLNQLKYMAIFQQ